MTRADAILEARRKLEAGEFQRAVVEVAPEDLDYDRITLECGHTKVWTPRMMMYIDKVSPLLGRCNQCAEEWIAGNTDAS